jgi:hypothetical protein
MPTTPGAGPSSLEELVRLLVSANDPDVGYSGILSISRAGETTRRWRVWRLRGLARVEHPPGRLSLLAGEKYYWRSWPVDNGITRIPRDPDVPFDFDLSALAMPYPHAYWTQWLGADPELVMRTIGPVEHQGRPAWRFTAPPVKGGTPVLTVDAELGLRVRGERADTGYLEEWSDLTVDPSLDPSFFEYHEH